MKNLIVSILGLTTFAMATTSLAKDLEKTALPDISQNRAVIKYGPGKSKFASDWKVTPYHAVRIGTHPVHTSPYSNANLATQLEEIKLAERILGEKSKEAKIRVKGTLKKDLGQYREIEIDLNNKAHAKKLKSTLAQLNPSPKVEIVLPRNNSNYWAANRLAKELTKKDLAAKSSKKLMRLLPAVVAAPLFAITTLSMNDAAAALMGEHAEKIQSAPETYRQEVVGGNIIINHAR